MRCPSCLRKLKERCVNCCAPARPGLDDLPLLRDRGGRRRPAPAPRRAAGAPRESGDAVGRRPRGRRVAPRRRAPDTAFGEPRRRARARRASGRAASDPRRPVAAPARPLRPRAPTAPRDDETTVAARRRRALEGTARCRPHDGRRHPGSHRGRSRLRAPPPAARAGAASHGSPERRASSGSGLAGEPARRTRGRRVTCELARALCFTDCGDARTSRSPAAEMHARDRPGARTAQFPARTARRALPDRCRRVGPLGVARGGTSSSGVSTNTSMKRTPADSIVSARRRTVAAERTGDARLGESHRAVRWAARATAQRPGAHSPARPSSSNPRSRGQSGAKVDRRRRGPRAFPDRRSSPASAWPPWSCRRRACR